MSVSCGRVLEPLYNIHYKNMFFWFKMWTVVKKKIKQRYFWMKRSWEFQINIIPTKDTEKCKLKKEFYFKRKSLLTGTFLANNFLLSGTPLINNSFNLINSSQYIWKLFEASENYFPQIWPSINIIDEQAGAELCQAQGKLELFWLWLMYAYAYLAQEFILALWFCSFGLVGLVW